jgi:hypothetical protein
VVIGGMLAATCIAVCLIPVTFFVIEKFATRKHPPKPEAKAGTSGEATSEGVI